MATTGTMLDAPVGVPEFVRGPIWVSEEARGWWEARLAEYSRVWQRIEVESVRQRVRGSALVLVSPAELPALSVWAAESGLGLAVLQEQAMSGTYAASTPTDGPRGLRVAVHRNSIDGQAWHRAWGRGGDEAIGRLLGFPLCCREAFAKTWGQGSRDPSYAQADGQEEVGGMHPGTNLLLRWIGVRLVSHLPCSFECKPTAALADGFIAVARDLDLDIPVAWALNALASRMTYSTLHGVGVVTTPFLRVEFSSDYAPETRRFVKVEDPLPEASTPAHQRLMELTPTSWQDNGFRSQAVMDAAHAPILALIRSPAGRVIDLGCGDGALLERIRLRGGECWGYDMDEGRVGRGATRYPQIHLLHQTILDWASGHEVSDVIIFMPGRLQEMRVEQQKVVLAALRSATRRLIVYAYDDWVGEGLASLCERVGLPKPAHVVKAHGIRAEAGVIKW